MIGPTDYANGTSFSRDGALLAVSSADATVSLYDLSGGRRPIATLDNVGGAVYSARFSPDGRRLVGSGRADSVPVWTLDPQAASSLVCARAGTDITNAEWTQYVPGAAYDPPCG